MFTVIGSSVTGIKIGSATVNPDNYTIIGGNVTIKGTYLTSLANGNKTFTFITDNGNVSATLSIGD